ncbi:MAG: response regulator [Thermoplasmata archaeon]
MEDGTISVLVVDDNPGDARLVQWALAHEPEARYHCERVSRIAAALDHLDRSKVDAVLLDLGLPDSQGTDGLRRLREKAPRTPVIVLTGSENPSMVRAAIAAGAQDYLVKGIFPRGYLQRTLEVALQREALETSMREGRLPEARALSELGRSGDGVAVIDSGMPQLLNDAFVALTGLSRGAPGGIPPWLAGILGHASAPSGRGPVEPAETPTFPMGVGELLLDRPSALPVELAYVVRRFPNGATPRVLVFVREISKRPRDSDLLASPPSGTEFPSVPRGTEREALSATLDRLTWEHLRELAGTDATFLPALVAAFLEEGRLLVGRLETAAAEGDAAAMVRGAHSLKSSCAQVGALALARRCAALEARGEAGSPAAMRSLVEEIAAEFPPVEDALRARFPRR